MKRLTLLSRSYCHLCDDMRTALQAMQGGLPFSVEVVDVDNHPALEERYGDLVPVLLDGETEICHYFLDAAKLTTHLTASPGAEVSKSA